LPADQLTPGPPAPVIPLPLLIVVILAPCVAGALMRLAGRIR
jgi:hypothetical protein